MEFYWDTNQRGARTWLCHYQTSAKPNDLCQLETASSPGDNCPLGMALFLNQSEVKILFHSQLEMDLTHVITSTRKTQELCDITGVVQHRQYRPGTYCRIKWDWNSNSEFPSVLQRCALQHKWKKNSKFKIHIEKSK